MEIRDLFAMKRVSAPAMSPDSHWVAYTVTTVDPENDIKQAP